MASNSFLSLPSVKERKERKNVTFIVWLQFFIEVSLRGQVLRKTSLCGEKCTGNKLKWHWEVQLSAMINGTYASWMCSVPLPCWLFSSEVWLSTAGFGLKRQPCNLCTRGSALTEGWSWDSMKYLFTRLIQFSNF